MISMVMLLLLVGLVAFGPKKTIEMAQTAAQAISQIKQAGREYQSALTTTAEADRESSEQPRCNRNL